ncbi:MAG: hypothetical protein WKF96_25380 [Solirubrobacteraceae bacterium]
MVADLGATSGATFEQLLRYPIVRALCNERHTTIRGTTTVGPAAGDDSVWVLRQGNDHRGATWFDHADKVVWLCAYGRHRSGEPDDAFQHFAALRGCGAMLPTEADCQTLVEDRAERFAYVVAEEASELLAAARARPGVEQRRMIGTTQPVGLIVHVVETLDETFVAVYGDVTMPDQLLVLLVALCPERAFEEWRWEPRMPTRELDVTRGEICFSIIGG